MTTADETTQPVRGELPSGNVRSAASAGPATDELSLEPLRLIEKSDVVVRIGALMLGAGTGSFRIKEAMNRVARALGLDRMHAQVTLTEIVVTTASGQIFRTQVVEKPAPGVNAARIAELEKLTLQIRPGVPASRISARLDEIEQRKPRYPIWLVSLAAGWACLAFAFLNNGGWQECVAVGLAVCAAQFVRVLLHRFHLNPLGVTMVSSAVACLGYLGVWALLAALTGQQSALHDAGFTSALLFLVPGFPLMTAALDLARLEMTAGIARLGYAALVVLAAALSAWMIAWAFNLTPVAAPLPAIPVVALVGGWAVAGFLGVLGFALMFHSPVRIALLAAVIGSIANTMRLVLNNFAEWPPQLSAVIATLVVGLLASLLVKRFPMPRITASVPAVLIMIPGATAYRALVYFNQGQTLDALQNGIQAVLIVVSLAVGLAAARILSDREWRTLSVPGFRFHPWPHKRPKGAR